MTPRPEHPAAQGRVFVARSPMTVPEANESSAAQTSGDSMIDAYRHEIATQTAEVERLRTWLSRIRNNAQSWHGADPDGIDHAHHGQQKALNVIAGWCEEALNGE